jgi:Phospholipase_D-nuclease N-terminal
VFVGGGLIALLVLALWVYCIFDVIATSEALMRNLPKVLWLVIVIFLPTIGSLAWLLLGRPERAGFAPGDTKYRPESRGRQIDPTPRQSTRTIAPDDDPGFLAEIDERAKKLREWEDELKRREEELHRRENDDPE